MSVPIVSVPSQVPAIFGTFVATGLSNPLKPISGRDFNITIGMGASPAVATVQVERSFNNGATWYVVLTDAMRTSLPESFTLNESEAGVLYQLNCTGYTSGTVTYRISQ